MLPSMNHQIFLSIVVPCYNVQDNICRTTESILQQTCSDFEIIMVDDGSTDNTSEILEQLALQDNRIKLIHKSNGGVSSARNIGLSNASGHYVLFLDGDDTIDSELLSGIKRMTTLTDRFDMLLYGFNYEKKMNKYIQYQPYYTSNYIQEYLLGKLHVCISSFVVKKDFLMANGISFNEETFYSEDREFIVRCFQQTNDIAIIHKPLFCYRYNGDSAMHTSSYTKKRSTSLDAMKRVYESLQGTKTENSALASLKITIIRHWQLYFKSGCTDSFLFGKLKQYSKQYLYKTNSILPLSRISVYSSLLGYLYRFQPIFKTILSI